MLEEIIKKEWPFGKVLSLARYPYGVINDTFSVITETVRYSLRVYRDHSLSDVEFEVALLDCLSGLPTPRIIPINGSKIWKIDSRYAIIYEYIDGEHLDVFTPDELRAVGKFLASFHIKGEDFVWQGKRFEFYSFPSERISSIMSLCEQKKIGHEDVLVKVAADVEQCRLPIGLPTGPIHVDVKPQNVLFRNGELKGVLDFDNAYIGSYLLDLSKSMVWFGFENGLFNFPSAAMIYEGYASVRPLIQLEHRLLLKALKFAFASHIFADFYMYAIGKTSKEYFNFIVNDFYNAYQSFIHAYESNQFSKLD